MDKRVLYEYRLRTGVLKYTRFYYEARESRYQGTAALQQYQRKKIAGGSRLRQEPVMSVIRPVTGITFQSGKLHNSSIKKLQNTEEWCGTHSHKGKKTEERKASHAYRALQHDRAL